MSLPHTFFIGRSGGGGESLYDFTDATFGSGSGINGPSRTLAKSLLTGTGVSAWKNDTSFFDTSNGIQLWTVPQDGLYRIQARGAKGGRGEQSLGQGKNVIPGRGAVIQGSFNLIAGQIIKIMVGQIGGDGGSSGNYAGGGGGGSFVTDSSNNPLIIAGGGNGENWGSWDTGGPDALTGSSPITSAGQGGGGGRGGGGGGLNSDGLDGDVTNGGGASFINGGQGGSQALTGGVGGFGGGGGSRYEGGGGGGYSGGTVVPSNQYSNSYPTYGAASFNSGSSQINSGANNATGSVIITLL